MASGTTPSTIRVNFYPTKKRRMSIDFNNRWSPMRLPRDPKPIQHSEIQGPNIHVTRINYIGGTNLTNDQYTSINHIGLHTMKFCSVPKKPNAPK